MEEKLMGKKVLFIAPIFHSYHEFIIEELTRLGALVSFFPERNYGFLFKAINNLSSVLLEKYQETHYNRIIQRTQAEEYDFLFVIRGYKMPEDFLYKFKLKNPLAKLVMYQWDSERTNPFSHLISFFDFKYSFDFQDCASFSELEYLPLFYTDDVSEVNQDNIEFDFFFMGYFFAERYDAVLRFREFALKNNYSLKAFLYIPFTTYLKNIIRGKRIDRSIVSLIPMGRKEYLNCLSKSKVMVDVSNPNQTGLAMRIIEALATNTKVLTNNYRLREDTKIYNRDAISFFDDKNPTLDNNEFLDIKNNPTKDKVLPINSWLQLIFKVN